MSVDTYFCFCCLSTTELINLFDINVKPNYFILLKELLSIKPSPDDYEYDSYICEKCAQSLKEAHSFRRKVFETLNILQLNGLIKLRKIDGQLLIKKVSDFTSDSDQKHDIDLDSKPIERICEDIKIEIKPKTESIKIEPQFKHLENTKICIGAEIIRPVLDNDPVKKLERENRVKPTQNESYDVTQEFKCTVCSMELPNAYVFHRHMNDHFPNHICEMCGKGFPTEVKLKRHKYSHDKGPFICQDCDAKFTNYSSFCGHRQRKHSSVLQYACPLRCGERFATFTRRARHLARAHAQRADRYKCPLCSATFITSGLLNGHIRGTHLKVTRHRCSECDASFYHKQDLTGHMAVHTGQNMFPCRVCSKRFPRKNALKVHMRIHTDDRRFCCDACGMKFIQKCALTAHMKTHNRNSDNTQKSTKMTTQNDGKNHRIVQQNANSTPIVHSNLNSTPTVHSILNSTPMVHSNLNSTPMVHSNLNSTPIVNSSLNNTTIVHSNLNNTLMVHSMSTQMGTLNNVEILQNDTSIETTVSPKEFLPKMKRSNPEECEKPILYNCYKLFY